MALRIPLATALAVGTALAVAAPAFAQGDESATVMQARGGLRGAIAPSTTWDDVAPGTRLKAGDTLKTPAGATAELVFGAGSRLALGENSIVRLQDLDGLAGRVLAGRVRLQASPEGMTTLAAGSLKLTGTDAEAVVEKAAGAWRVAVLAGSFRVTEAGKAPVDVEAGRVATWAGGAPRSAVITRGAWLDLTAGFGGDAAGAAPASAPAAGGHAANRWVATALSAVLPGAGQLYAGEVGRGLLYMGLNGALMGTLAYGVFFGQRSLVTYATYGLAGMNVLSPLDAVFTTSDAPASSAAALPTQLEPGFPSRSTPAFNP